MMLMLRLLFTLLAAVLATAAPVGSEKRQTWTGMWSEEFSYTGCKPVIFIWARQTLAPGNMGVSVGPALSNGLKAYYGAENVASQGVNYLGLIETNFYPGGGPPYGIYEMQVLLANAAIYCPQSKIVAAGYSQGAAITHRAIENLPQYVKDRIAGVVTFGDTQALQDGGRIKGYPIEKTMIICNPGDMVCWGSIYIAPTHFPAYYVARVPEAVAFLVGRLAATP
ncbi:cutinase-domain-containing protein [Podospora aff. communis PSN243]|uniref:cutinase n=1 Tax=Podospora aff. communis PSN243 TaxID=3040156 RepID=A0AAV9GGR0_9PEZI|nr:cutinase-domain-containing protein [Podospora aff. communis PSN243]